jgi:O-succinylhomoserine sulfhydrylase
VRAADPDQARQRAFAILDAVRTLTLSTNLGDVKTLVSHPASTSHGRLTEEQRQAAGIGQGLIRMSVGLENVGDLKADLARALGAQWK